MIFTKDAVEAFTDYLSALTHLEEAFQISGLNIEFHLDLSSISGMKFIAISYNGCVVNAICIEGDSVAQAIKDVAEAVRL